MGERPTIKLIDNPIAVGELRAGPEAQADGALPRQPGAGRSSPRAPMLLSEAGAGENNPYAGLRKAQAPIRLFPPLWDQLEQLSRGLRDEGHEVDKTALLNAILHFHGPADLDEARELINRWRALLARPPAPRT